MIIIYITIMMLMFLISVSCHHYKQNNAVNTSKEMITFMLIMMNITIALHLSLTHIEYIYFFVFSYDTTNSLF